MDFDIGVDAWPIAVAVVFGVFSLYMIITFKCAPEWGMKLYGGCCPEFMKSVNKQPENIGAAHHRHEMEHEKKVEMKTQAAEQGVAREDVSGIKDTPEQE